MQTNKIIYWISTAICCGMMAMSAFMYFTRTAEVEGFFTHFSYPTYLLIPLAIAKVLGIIAIVSRKSQMLKEWAYAGFFFDGLLAAYAHSHAGESPIMALVLAASVLLSRYFGERAYPHSL
jgi:hypothetical protein